MAWDYEQIVRDLQDTMAVLVGIQARRAEVFKGQSQGRAEHEQRAAAREKSQELHKQRMDHIEQTLLEIGGKLNGLIGYRDNQHRPPA